MLVKVDECICRIKKKKNHDDIGKDAVVTEIAGREPRYTLRFRSCS
jgi:hypothetical protein